MSDLLETDLGAPAASAEAGDDMHIHKPKAAHSLREFLSEIGVIVLGIAIALLGEQAVEAVHWRHNVEQAEQAMRTELSLDDGAQAFARVAVGRCLDDQLAAIVSAVEAGRDRSEVARLTDAYQPPLRSWDRQSWDAAVASDIASHVGAERLNRWSRVFDLMPLLNAQTTKEAEGVDLLTGGSAAKGPLSPDQADRTIRAAKSLRRVNAQMTSISQHVLSWLGPLDAEPPQDRQAAILAEARRRFGSCVVAPDPSQPLRSLTAYGDLVGGHAPEERVSPLAPAIPAASSASH